MKGKLYGVGVGPGDPELLTLKALRLIRENPVIAVPGEDIRASVAYQIVKGAYEALDEKTLLPVAMPMTKDPAVLEANHEKAAGDVEAYLGQGKNVVFLTLGDPTVYSTYLYVHKRILARGYEAEIVSGITSFCAVAARLNMGLVERDEPLHVIPATYQAFAAGTLEDVKGFCAVAATEEIARQDYILTPGRYVGIEEQVDDGEPFEEKMARLTSEVSDLFAKSHQLEDEIKAALKQIGF